MSLWQVRFSWEGQLNTSRYFTKYASLLVSSAVLASCVPMEFVEEFVVVSHPVDEVAPVNGVAAVHAVVSLTEGNKLM